MDAKRLRQVVTLGALIVAFAHLIWPSLAIDAITIVLLASALIPWLAPLFKSLEFPGGWKIEFPELQKAGDRAESAGLLAPAAGAPQRGFAFQAIAEEDPNLALAGLRIEIEKRLRLLAESRGLAVDRAGLGQLLRLLSQREILSTEERSVLADLTGLLNSAVHGARVGPGSASWAMEVGPRLLKALDERVSEKK